MTGKERQSSCELPVSRRTKKPAPRNRIFKFQKGFTWKGTGAEKYKASGEDWAHIARHVLIGTGGEQTDFHLRYFEISSGGYSSFETHEHEHVVIGIRGKGRIRLNGKNVDIDYLDVLYIKPHAPHRLYNPYKKPFGFFCIVNAERDMPKPAKRGDRKR